jgi:hypothetical protein
MKKYVRKRNKVPENIQSMFASLLNRGATVKPLIPEIEGIPGIDFVEGIWGIEPNLGKDGTDCLEPIDPIEGRWDKAPAEVRPVIPGISGIESSTGINGIDNFEPIEPNEGR